MKSKYICRMCTRTLNEGEFEYKGYGCNLRLVCKYCGGDVKRKGANK